MAARVAVGVMEVVGWAEVVKVAVVTEVVGCSALGLLRMRCWSPSLVAKRQGPLGGAEGAGQTAGKALVFAACCQAIAALAPCYAACRRSAWHGSISQALKAAGCLLQGCETRPHSCSGLSQLVQAANGWAGTTPWRSTFSHVLRHNRTERRVKDLAH